MAKSSVRKYRYLRMLRTTVLETRLHEAHGADGSDGRWR
jgi:hypothetical protein